MITRLAPTPSGLLHLGHARAFLAAWWVAHSQGGKVLYRCEDLDPPRTVPGADAAAQQDLAWLGMDWDGEPTYQSKRYPIYQHALERLADQGLIYGSRHSRAELATLAQAPHGQDFGPDGHPPFPKEWRPATRLRAQDLESIDDAAIRFAVPEGEVAFTDALQGLQRQDVATQVGDFVLRRRDGLYAYQLAVVVDDLAQGVTHIVRGMDLLYSTPRQIVLIEAFGGTRPAYAHVGYVTAANGQKLSKKEGALPLAQLRAAGITPEQIVGWAARSLGLQETHAPAKASEFVNGFAWHDRAGQNVVAPEW